MENLVRIKKTVYLFLILIGLFVFSLVNPSKTLAGFRFVTWGDSRDSPSILGQESTQVKTLSPQPVFTLFNGDLCGSWSTSCMQAWVGYINGSSNNGIGNITFPVRGNHDSGSGTAWSTFFNQSTTATRVGATNYSALTPDMTYSFDYQNAHFVGLDLPGGDVSSMSSAEITWLDNDLKAAEARGIQLEFLFWHGPLYYVDDHSSSAPGGLVTVLNNHPNVVAGYYGHEHVLAHVTVDSSRYPAMTNHAIEEFVDGTAGAPHYSCASGRSDFCQAVDAFAVTDVLSDTQFTVSLYKLGSGTPIYQKTFTKGVVTPPGSGTPSPTGAATPTPRSSPTPTPGPRTPTPIPTPTINPQVVDVNSDRTINIVDIGIIIDNYAQRPPANTRADINHDGVANIIDIGLIIDHYGQTY
jgi:hypothetical protein